MNTSWKYFLEKSARMAIPDIRDEYGRKTTPQQEQAMVNKANSFNDTRRQWNEYLDVARNNFGGNLQLAEDALNGGIRPVYPELWLADAKLVGDLARLGSRAIPRMAGRTKPMSPSVTSLGRPANPVSVTHDAASMRMRPRRVRMPRSLKRQQDAWLEQLASLRGLKSGQLGHTSRRIRQMELQPGAYIRYTAPETASKLMTDDVLRLNQASLDASVNWDAMQKAFQETGFIKDMDTLRELSPAVYRNVMGHLKFAKPPPSFKTVKPYEPAYRPNATRSFPVRDKGFEVSYKTPLVTFTRKAYDRAGANVRSTMASDPSQLIPVDMVDGGLNFSKDSIDRIRSYLLDSIKDGTMKMDHPMLKGNLYARWMGLYPSKSSAAYPGSSILKRPRINLEIITGPDGRKYINKTIARHEFGHVYDLHGRWSRDNALRRVNSGWGDPRVIDEEMRANAIGGVSQNNPALDMYRATLGDVNELKNIFRRYPESKPAIPR